MALKIAAAAALAQGCSAFVPMQGPLRTGVRVAPEQVDSAVAESAADEVAPASNGALPTTSACLASAVVAGLAAGSTLRRHRKVPCRALGLTETVGVCAPFYEKFDPLNLGNTDAKMERYTAVEIKHGRISMLACLGYVMPEYFHFPGCETFSNGLGALSSVPIEGWVQLVGFLGAHEVLVKPREGGMGIYDFGLGTELLQGCDAEELNRRQTVERNNGRLAMIAIMGLMVQDGMFGTDVMSYMKREGWWGQPVDWLVKDIPVCSFGCALAPKKRSTGLTAMRAVVYEDPMPVVRLREQEMSAACPFLKYPEPLRGWVGGEKGFDPLNVTMALPTYLVREAELKHGRVCMLATVGWIATDFGARFPGDVFQNASTISAHNDCVDAGYMQPFLGFVGTLELYGGYLLLQGMSNHLGSDSTLERDAGDFFVGKQFLPKEEDKANEMKLKELENGRLAMLAFSGIVTQAVAYSKPWPFL